MTDNQAGSKMVESAEDPSRFTQLHPLKVELEDKIHFYEEKYRAVYLRLALELVSQGYSVITAVSFLKEAWDAAILDTEGEHSE